MTNTQHTPGPWTICPRGRLTPGATVPIHSAPDAEGFRLTVAHVRTIGPEGDADARLIAACPELLDALRAAAELIDYALPKFDWGKSALDGKAIQLLNEAPMTVRAAIAKATGK